MQVAKRPTITTMTQLTTNESAALSRLNTNLTNIRNQFDNTLSRDGSTPNVMEADLDLNGNQILNLPAATTSTEPVRKQEFDEALEALTVGDIEIEFPSIPDGTEDLTHTPTQLNTYASNLRQKLEWDALTAYDFLSSAQRANPNGVDCLSGLQDYADFLLSQNTGKSYKYMRLGGSVPFLISNSLVFEGQADKNGYVILRDGGLQASSSWPSQATLQVPMVHFSTDSANCGMEGVLLDCNGYAAGGVLVDDSVDALQIRITKNKIKNYNNPSYQTQGSLYSNTVTVSTVGGNKQYSAVAARKYWNSHGHKSPYGIRVGTLDTSTSDMGSSSCKIIDNDIRQWDQDRAEADFFERLTGIGIWVESSDAVIKNNKTIRANLKAILIGEGNHNEVIGNHISPYGSFSSDYRPTSTQFVMGIEDSGDGTIIMDNYHECTLWKNNGSGKIVGNMFPRGGEFSDGNTVAIMFDAWEVGSDWETSDNCIIHNNTYAQDYLGELIGFREADSNTFAWNGPDVSQMTQNFGDIHIGVMREANLYEDDTVREILSNHGSRALFRARHNTSATDVEFGNVSDRFGVRIGGANIGQLDSTYLELGQNQYVKGSGSAQVKLIGGIGYGTGHGVSGTTQGTSKSTALTSNGVCGQFTTHNATLNAGAKVQFQFNNSSIEANDFVHVWRKSGGTNASYEITVDRVDAGFAVVRIENISGSNLSEALVLGFIVFKASTN